MPATMITIKTKKLWAEMTRRLSRCIIDEQQRKILLAQLFSMVIMAFMTLLFIDTLSANNAGHSFFPAIFILLTAANYAWLSHARRSDMANDVIIILLGCMCLYLFYTGGVADTGPFWSFLFIPVAVFLGGNARETGGDWLGLGASVNNAQKPLRWRVAVTLQSATGACIRPFSLAGGAPGG